jgi:hypothetical protein
MARFLASACAEASVYVKDFNGQVGGQVARGDTKAEPPLLLSPLSFQLFFIRVS